MESGTCPGGAAEGRRCTCLRRIESGGDRGAADELYDRGTSSRSRRKFVLRKGVTNMPRVDSVAIAIAASCLFSASASIAEGSWPPKSLAGVWLVETSSLDGEAIPESRGNLLIFHGDYMIFAVDGGYQPPNPVVATMGFKFYATSTKGETSLGLVRVQRGKLRFVIRTGTEDGESVVDVNIKDYSTRVVQEVVLMRAKETDQKGARKRIQQILEHPDLNTPDEVRHTLENWLQVQNIGEPSE